MNGLVKICGITTLEDALFCLKNGADALGFVAYSGSPRFITSETVSRIILACKKEFPISRYVGVFVTPEHELIKEYIDAGVDTIQLHANENCPSCKMNLCDIGKKIKIWLSFNSHLPPPVNIENAEAIHYDSYDPRSIGGTGRLSDWEQARQIMKTVNLPLILAGGLSCFNVANAINAVHPSGVDVSSGVEISKGLKDYHKIQKFISEAHSAYKQIKTE